MSSCRRSVWLIGRVDFKNLYVALNGQAYASLAEAQKAGAPTINYGIFLNTSSSSLIVAFVVFLLVRQINKLDAAAGRRAGPSRAATAPTAPRRFPRAHGAARSAPRW